MITIYSNLFQQGQKKMLNIPEQQIFSIHDNGGIPYTVVISERPFFIEPMPICNTTITIYNNKPQKVVEKVYRKFKKVFVGEDHIEGQDGNSILIQLTNTQYVYIGHIIFEFETSDQIQKYYSNLGNNDVPYPVAVGEKNAYFMLDRKYVAKENIYRNVKNAKKFKISTCSPFYRLLTKKYSKDFTEEEWADCYGYYYRNNFKDVCNF